VHFDVRVKYDTLRTVDKNIFDIQNNGFEIKTLRLLRLPYSGLYFRRTFCLHPHGKKISKARNQNDTGRIIAGKSLVFLFHP
jgi:hypothetical protein